MPLDTMLKTLDFTKAFFESDLFKGFLMHNEVWPVFSKITQDVNIDLSGIAW
jgi:hypothetical protein